jgi:O-antigen/teichoic acid export membrane protein
MNPLKKLAGQTVLYGLGSILPRMLNFLLLPLHTISMFSREEYAVVTQLMAIVAVVNIVFMFGMETTFFRFATREGADRKKIFNIAQTVVLMISIPLSIVFIVFASSIASSLDIGSHPEFIVYLTLVMLIDSMVAIPFAQLRLRNQALKFAAFKIINVSVLIGLNLYFLKIAYDPAINVGYVFIANLAANGLYLLFFIKELFSWRPALDKEMTPVMLRYSFPIMITGIAGMYNEMFSRLSLEYWLPEGFYSTMTKKAAVGVFGSCYKLAVFMNLGIQAFRYAAEPFFFSNAANKNSPALFARVNHYFVITCCAVLLGISINLDMLQYLMGADYRTGLPIVPVLLLAYLFLGIYYNFSVWFKITDKTYYGTIITLGGAGLTLVGNYLLIPMFGFMGSSWAAVICYFSMTAACYFIGQKFHPIPYAIWKGLTYIAVTMGIVAVVNSITIGNLWLSVSFHAGVMAVFVIAVYFVERRYFRQPVI